MATWNRIFPSTVFLLLVFSQCALFEPKIATVPEAYVREEVMTSEQKNAITILKSKVVQMKNEVSALRKSNALTTQSILVSYAKMQKHAAERDLAKEKEAYYLLKEEPNLAKKWHEEKQSAELERAKEETRWKTWIQKEKEDKSLLVMREASLGEFISELELVKAEVAVKFQENQGKSSADPDFLQKAMFESQYSERKSEARRKLSEYERTKAEAISLPKVNLEDSFQ